MAGMDRSSSLIASLVRSFQRDGGGSFCRQHATRRRSVRIELLEPRTFLSASPIGQNSLFGARDPVVPSADIMGTSLVRSILECDSGQESDAGSGSHDPVPGLIHRWKLDEKSGLTAVDSVGGANGTLFHMAGTEWTDGFLAGSLAFDGSNDYISVGQVTTLQLANTMTISAWVNVHSPFPDWGGIAGWVHDTGSTESGYCLNTMTGGGLSFGLKTQNTDMIYLAASGYETGTWYHVAGTYDGSMQRLYINGEQVAEQANTGSIDWDPVGSDGFEIGRYHDDNENIVLPETIDDVRVYDRALTADEIRLIMEMNPVGEWNFDDPEDLVHATIGTDLALHGTDTAVAGFQPSDGAAEIGVGSYYTMHHGIDPNGGGNYVNEFTLAFDFMAPSINQWITFYQTNTTNSNDGDAFVRPVTGAIGVAATGYSSQGIAPNTWYRLVISVDNGSRYDIYLDGEKILDGTPQSIDGRFSLDPTLLVFADENGEDNTIQVSHLAIYNWALSDVQAAFLGSLSDAPEQLEFVTNPYLQNVDTDGIVVMWEMNGNVPMAVEYGLDMEYGSSVAASSTASGFAGTYIYKAKMSGLAEETSYHFRVLDNTGTPMTEDRTFTTFTTNEIDFSFAMWGDSQGHNHGTWSADPYAPTNSMLDHMVTQGIDFAFSVGDLAENGSSYADTRNYYLDRVAKHLGPSIPWFNAWGNHDGDSGSILRNFADMPSQDRGAPYTSGYGSFAFEQAGVLFIAIDYFSSYIDITGGWLESILQAHPDPRFTVLGVHVPPYCERWIDGNSTFRENLVPLAEQYGVDVIVSGHTHEYERGELNNVHYVITGQGSWLDLTEPIVADWDHMTVGGAHDLPGMWAIQSSYGVLGDPQPIVGGLVNGYTEFVIHGNTLDFRMHAFNADGSYIGVLDHFSIAGQLAGDFNLNGSVDGDDLEIWGSGFGTIESAQRSDGDADGDADVDGNDFLVWQQNFGSGPEPATGGSAAISTAKLGKSNVRTSRTSLARSPSSHRVQATDTVMAGLLKPAWIMAQSGLP
ncbi:MAG: metallophosphoesterase [Pirellulales bacterium]|nr:metallophosphoesterase [Pirellulales bacterium]